MPQSTQVRCGAATAHACASVADPLRELLGQPVAAWVGRGFGLVKERTVRSVFAGRLGDLPVHMKLFRAHKLSDRARDAVRGQRGERECRNLLRARALALPAVEPLAFGLALDGDDLRSFVVTRTVDGAERFSFAMTAAVHERVGALLRRVHDAGVLAEDLHAGNLLVDDAAQPWLVDLTSMRHGGEPDLARRARGLAFFCHELDGGALDRRARSLLAAYRRAGSALPPGLDDELALATRRWRADALPAFGRRSRRTCRHTEADPKRRGEPRWYWHLPGVHDALRARCRAFAASPPPPTKSGRRGAVWLTDDLAVKRRERGAARKLWRAAYWLLFAGVDAPPPVALCLQADAGLVFAARIAGPSLAQELAAGTLAPAARLACAAALGRSVGRLHAHGLRNRDLKLENLVRVPGTDRVAMVDLDGIRRKAALDSRGAGADLGRLLAAFRGVGSPGGSATVRAFLRGWLRAHRDLLVRPPVRRLLRRAERRAGEWVRAHAAGD